MGIQGLAKLLGDCAPAAIREQKLDSYFGRKIAVDASMHIYQFMVVVGRQGDQLLANEAGDVTSHLSGMFYRTVKMLEAGIKPIFVFDGKAPKLKADELARRSERRGEATAGLEEAKAAGDNEAIEKYAKRSVRVTREHNDDCKRLLRLMGVPYYEAPSEAEAQCCALAKSGMVYAVATEDMDALTFGTPKLARHLMSQTSGAGKGGAGNPMEFDYNTILKELDLTSDQFVDMCILCGCDYCGRIPGIGPKKAFDLIKKHGCIEKVIEAIDTTKYELPTPFPFEEARKLFKEPDVTSPENLEPPKWKSPDAEGLVQFLVTEKQFSEDRIRKGMQRIEASKSKASQGRLESFFGPATIKSSNVGTKRKDAASGKGAVKGVAAKKGKAGGIGAGKGKK